MSSSSRQSSCQSAVKETSDWLGLGPILKPHLRLRTGLAGVSGCIDGIGKRLIFIEVSAINRIVKAHHPSPASIVPVDVKLHYLH
jgi:hypothetical protein